MQKLITQYEDLSIPENGLQYKCKVQNPRLSIKKLYIIYIKLKFEENNTNYFSLSCNVNQKIYDIHMYITSKDMSQQCKTEKSCMAVSHGLSWSHTSDYVRKMYIALYWHETHY